MLARVPIVIGTEVNIYEHKRPAHALAERLLMAGTDRVVVSAESVRDFYIKQVHADPREDRRRSTTRSTSRRLEATMPRAAVRARARHSARRAGRRRHRPADRAERASLSVRGARRRRRTSPACICWWSAAASCATSWAGAPTRSASRRACTFSGPRRDLGESARRDGRVRDAVALGRPAAVAGARDGRRRCRSSRRGRRHSRGRRRRTNRAARAAGRCRPRSARRWRGCSAIRRCAERIGVDGPSRPCCRDSASTRYVESIVGLYDGCSRARPREARHRVSHAVLAGRRRHAARGRRIVRAVRRFAGAVFRRDLAVRAGARPRRAATARRFGRRT